MPVLLLGAYAPACTDVMSSFGNDSTFLRLYYPSAFTKEQVGSYSGQTMVFIIHVVLAHGVLFGCPRDFGWSQWNDEK